MFTGFHQAVKNQNDKPMKRVLGIGNALVDIMTVAPGDEVLEKFNLPKGSMQLVDGPTSDRVKQGTNGLPKSMSSGGSAANTIHGLAMLGCETGFIGSIGTDETGDFFEKDMKSAGVNTFLIRSRNVTGTAVALVTPDSERTFATHLGASIELGATDLRPEFFEGYDIFYLEGYLINNMDLVLKACEMAKERGKTIAIDMASYNVLEAFLDNFVMVVGKYADIVFANEDEARAFTGLLPDEALGKISGSCEIAVVKRGADGSMLKRGEEVIKVGPLPVTCTDTTGAGDLYAAGFLYGYASGLDLETCGLMGSIAAGEVIRITGARMGKPGFDKIRSSIRKMTKK